MAGAASPGVDVDGVTIRPCEHRCEVDEIDYDGEDVLCRVCGRWWGVRWGSTLFVVHPYRVVNCPGGIDVSRCRLNCPLGQSARRTDLAMKSALNGRPPAVGAPGEKNR